MKFLCLEDADIYKAGILYKAIRASLAMDKRFAVVETFERDGVEWIKHDGGDCPVPESWMIETTRSKKREAAGWWHWGSIEWKFTDFGYRIISTGEGEQPEASSIDDVAHRVPESITAVDPLPAPVESPYYLLDDES